MMDSSEDALWFMGDLSDPWVVSIAGELARCTSVVQVHCPGDLPDRPFDLDRPPRLMVIHRHRFTAVDAQRLKEYRVCPVAGDAPAILLCVSPYVRYEELERWSGLADLVISEATAADILPRHVARSGREASRPVDASRDGWLPHRSRRRQPRLVPGPRRGVRGRRLSCRPGRRPRNRQSRGPPNVGLQPWPSGH